MGVISAYLDPVSLLCQVPVRFSYFKLGLPYNRNEDQIYGDNPCVDHPPRRCGNITIDIALASPYNYLLIKAVGTGQRRDTSPYCLSTI